ncbi:reverse transcriptase domain-containing protein [Tanacetum coccineum]|uniref:Reverse transcriptase domain-containing protein n=1 Tax=Tanacetum coccineum TaxID=301880 RepID=A0ABQ5DC43_9ASTR
MHKEESTFSWTGGREGKLHFKQMKEVHSCCILVVYLCSRSEEQEELIVYLAASKEAVSAVLMTEREARQMPIYFVNRALRGPKVNYTVMEKLVLALVHASKRLRMILPSLPYHSNNRSTHQKHTIKPGSRCRFYRRKTRERRSGRLRKRRRTAPGTVDPVSGGSFALMDCGAGGDYYGSGREVAFTYAIRFQFEKLNNEADMKL